MTGKRMAVFGTGSIGLMLGAFLARNGFDVTLVSQFRPDMAALLRREGVRVTFGAEEWTQPVRAVFWQALGPEGTGHPLRLLCRGSVPGAQPCHDP